MLCVAALALAGAPAAAAAEPHVTLTPASGVPGTAAAVSGRGFGRRTRVLVKVGGKKIARVRANGRGGFNASFTAPARLGSLRVLTISRGLRISDLFRVSASATEPQAGEISLASGTRLRWAPRSGPVGTVMRLRGTRFPAKRRVKIKFGSAKLRGGRTDRHFRYSRRVIVPALGHGGHRVQVRIKGRSLGFRFTIGEDPLVVAAGDIACDPASPAYNVGLGTPAECHMRQTSDLLAMLNPTAVLALGDLQYEAATLADFRTSYDPTWGRFKPITRPVAGNHEYGSPGAAGYFSYWGAVAGAPGKGYYSFDVGAWHVIALNSNCTIPGIHCTVGFAQEQWLRSDLARHRNRCVLAMWHHPLFGSGQEGSHPTMRDLFQDLYDARADLLLAGHDHDYERFAPQTVNGGPDPARGIREIVVGTGGKDLMTFRKTILPNSEVRSDTAYGVLALRLHPASYDWQFVPEPGGTFHDAGSQACH